jgi:protein gp37
MADHSHIEWTDATWNPITGCSVVSPGCANCYAMTLAGTRLKHHPSRAGLTQASKAGPVWTGEVRFNEAWLDQPLRWRRPRMVFVCAHGDLFHESVPDAWIDKVFAVMALAQHHTFQVLTKRAKRMRQYLSTWPMNDMPDRITTLACDIAYKNGRGWQGNCGVATRPLPNLWLGVSAERQQEADARIPDLLATPASVRFVSLEPLLGPIDLTNIEAKAGVGVDVFSGLEFDGDPADDVEFGTATLDWVIVGGESGTAARPMHPDWARSLRDQCTTAGVPFFFKQHGEWIGVPDLKQLPGGSGPGFGACDWSPYDQEHEAVRVGKARAGRLLDGREWSQMPCSPPPCGEGLGVGPGRRR